MALQYLIFHLSIEFCSLSIRDLFHSKCGAFNLYCVNMARNAKMQMHMPGLIMLFNCNKFSLVRNHVAHIPGHEFLLQCAQNAFHVTFLANVMR